MWDGELLPKGPHGREILMKALENRKKDVFMQKKLGMSVLAQPCLLIIIIINMIPPSHTIYTAAI